jgi:BirA family biotin operon repressor/biotin-[acetyl-CoA-carboxylase] ligase
VTHARFDPQLFSRLARAHRLTLGQPVVAVGVTGSTNDDAMAAARAGAPHGALFVAEHQSCGRGRRGRTWHSPAGTSLLGSVVLRPALEPEQAQPLTLVLGLATRDAVACYVDVPVGIKWPNDVIADGRKLAGVLVEAQLQGGRVQALVAGIGINVTTRSFPASLQAQATSLALLGARNVAREPLWVDLLAAFESRLQSYLNSGLEALLPQLQRHDFLRGKRVGVQGVVGVARGVDSHGALLVQDDVGQVHRLSSGSVELA